MGPGVNVADAADWVTKLGVRFERGTTPPGPEFPPGAWDIDNASYAGVTVSIGANRSLDWRWDTGTRLWVSDRTAEEVRQYDASTGWDITTLTFDGVLDVSGQMGSGQQEASALHGIFVRRDNGQQLYLWNRTEIWQYQLGTGWDITTATQVGYLDMSAVVARGHDIHWRADGQRFYVEDRSAEEVTEWHASTPWDAETLTHIRTLDISAQQQAVRGIELHPEGIRFWLLDTDREDVLQYNMSTAWDVSTAMFDQAFDVSPQTGSTLGPYGFSWKDDGSMFWVCDSSGDLHAYAVEEP